VRIDWFQPLPLQHRNLIRAGLITVAGFVIVVPLVAMMPGPLQLIRDWFASSTFNDERSDAERLSTISDGYLLWSNYPVFGGGLGAYVADRVAAGMDAQVLHSVAIWFMAELGLVGLAAYVALLASFIGWGTCYR